MYFQDHVLEGIAELKRHPTEASHTNNITILPLILSKEVLDEVCCHGGVSKVGGVASAACEILGSLVILREELFWPELLESLLQWMPYIEVGTLPTVVYIILFARQYLWASQNFCLASILASTITTIHLWP